MAGGEREAILDYHEATKHTPWSVRTSTHRLDWANEPLAFKIYRDLEPIPLAGELPARGVATLEAIARSGAARAPEGGERVPDLAALSRVLHLAAGITKHRRLGNRDVYFRAYSNTGALYHVDLYAVTGPLPDLPAGVYHFGPHDYALRRLREGDWRGACAEATGGSEEAARAPVLVASASTWWRNAWKYQARSWRHGFWDTGTLHANLLAAAASEGLDPRLLLGWADPALERLLGLDPDREGALTLVALGRGGGAPPPVEAVPELAHATEPLSPREVEYPLVRKAQRDSALPDGTAAAAWRAAAAKPGAEAEPPAAEGPLVPLRPFGEGALPEETLERTVHRRGSTRAFDPRRSLSFEALSTALERATRGLRADFLPEGGATGATLVELFLVVNAVQDLAPGLYLLRRDEGEAGALECLREGDLRRAAGGLALGQALAAEAAVNVYSLAELPRVLGPLGARGYRAAQLEAGITGGRLYLAAYAQGFGATGLTFFDDEVPRLFGPRAEGKSPMFLTALGYPDVDAMQRS